ncbi:NAD-dependent dehydratase [Candidatus Bathyarchaeota archaeon]|nr:NAD-dependent dehydratase [Candidatus Bathyarchaeota archaeon]
MNLISEDVNLIVSSLLNEGISFDKQNVLVTGGAGFLGSWTCETLLGLGARVFCLDNLSSGRLSNLERIIGDRNFSYINHDISNPFFPDKQIDLILHLASRASPLEFSRYPIQILKANTLGTWVTLGIAKKCNSRYVLASTSEVYGDPPAKNVPTPETYNGNVNPIGARSCYDESKRVAEAFTMAYHNQHELDTRIMRIFNTYGPRMRGGDVYGRVVSRFIEQALLNKPITIFGDGNQTRTFTYVSDLIKGLIKTAFLPDISGQVFNIGGQGETTILALANLIKQLSGTTSEITYQSLPPDDPKRRCPDTSKAVNILNWNAEISLRKGLEKTVLWHNQC